MAASPAALTTIGVRRDGVRLSLPLELSSYTDDQGQLRGHLGVSVKTDKSMLERDFVQYGFFESIGLGAMRTWEMTSLTLRFIWKLLSGQVSTKHIGGPIMIAEYAGLSILIGLGTFLGAMALLSVSIGLLNLLPIPLLDGGHLMYYLIELIKGSPPSPAFQALANRAGLLMLGGLMFLALFNDITRLFTQTFN